MIEIAEEEKTGRDIRVDQVGFVSELVKQHADKLKERIKARMLEGSIDRSFGDFFEGLLVSSDKSEIPAKKFYKLFKDGAITESDFLDAISVNTGKARKLMAEKEFDRLAEVTAGTPSLRITRIKGVDLSLVKAVDSLSIPR